MDSNMHQTVEIDLKDLFFVIVKKMGIALLVGIIVAGAFFVYKYKPSANDVNVLDTSVKLDSETDSQYSERIQNVNRAEDMINSIDSINNQMDIQREYLNNSVIMQINPFNEAVSTAHLVIMIDDEQANGLDKALVSAYYQKLMSGDYLNELAEELGTQQGYLKELISVSYDSSSQVIVNSEEATGSVGTVTINVIGPDTNYTDMIMDCILDEMDASYSLMCASVVSHEFSLSGRQSFYKVDTNTRDLQYSAFYRIEAMQKDIDTINESLDEVTLQLGVSGKDSLYDYFSYGETGASASASPIVPAIKYSVVGFAGGVILVIFIVVLRYLFGNKFSTQSRFFDRFPQLDKIGVVKPTNKRSAISIYIDKKTGDDNSLSDENGKKLLAANIKNITHGMNKVLFTGTAEVSKIEELVKGLGIDADVKESFFVDPKCLETVSEYEGIIIVEQRNYTDCRLVAEELKLIANADTKLLGAIVL